MKSSPEEIRIYKGIDEILWNDWDPIGINKVLPRNEYYGYIPPIFQLAMSGADKETIAQKLDYFVVERMGLNSRIEHCRKIAEKIIKLR